MFGKRGRPFGLGGKSNSQKDVIDFPEPEKRLKPSLASKNAAQKTQNSSGWKKVPKRSVPIPETTSEGQLKGVEREDSSPVEHDGPSIDEPLPDFEAAPVDGDGLEKRDPLVAVSKDMLNKDMAMEDGAEDVLAEPKKSGKLFSLTGQGKSEGSSKTRILMQQGIEGEYVRRLQSYLQHQGFDPGPVDGVFGRMTTNALKALQKKFGTQQNGRVSFDFWTDITEQPVPSILERCLQLTASFEGRGFTKISGNHDNAGVSWGVIGYNLRSRSLQPIMDYFIDYRPEVVREAFGSLAQELVRVMESPFEEQLSWGDQISLGSQKHRVQHQWAEAFARFGEYEEVQKMQLEEAENNFWAVGVAEADRLDLQSELGVALCFDIVVQNGGIDGGAEDGPERRAILRRFDEERPGSERDRRVIIAQEIASHSLPQYADDVMSRKLTIASGNGVVHGRSYNLSHWGLGDVSWRP